MGASLVVDLPTWSGQSGLEVWSKTCELHGRVAARGTVLQQIAKDL